jgi:hypothetical protein
MISREMDTQNEIILYQPDNNAVEVEVRLENENVWLTQAQIALLFDVKVPAVSKHLKNIYNSGELDADSTFSKMENVGNDGRQTYQTKFYNLDAILSVGYRVNSRNATMFRRWATQVLKEYVLRGYAINQRFERIEHRLAENEKQIAFFVRTALPPKEGVFYDGQIFDAYLFASDLIKSAAKNIVLLDNYIDETVLLLLSKRQTKVGATIYTKQISAQLRLDVKKYNAQYEPVTICESTSFHDRFLIIDTTIYHLGASLKDLGKKLFAFSKMEITPKELLKNVK